MQVKVRRVTTTPTLQLKPATLPIRIRERVVRVRARRGRVRHGYGSLGRVGAVQMRRIRPLIRPP